VVRLRTISRFPTLTVTGAFRSVAGSKTVHWCLAPATRPPFGTCPAQRRDAQRQAKAAHLTGHFHGASPRIQRELERAEREVGIDARGGVNRRCADCAEQRHLQPAVLLQLEPIVFRNGLGDGKADFLAAVIHAAPGGLGSVAREIGRKVGRGGLDVGAVDQNRHDADPRDEDKERQRTCDGSS
jgi:hypothetical protein